MATRPAQRRPAAQRPPRPPRPPRKPKPIPPVDWRLLAMPPGGTFSFAVLAWPPSKSNRYQIVRPFGSPHMRLTKSAAVGAFEELMALAIRERLAALRYSVQWEQPPLTAAQLRQGTHPRPRVVNPLFGDDVEVDVFVDLYEPLRTVRDTDNVLKVLQDVCTRAGIFRDDRQIGDVHVRRREHVGERPAEETHVHLVAVTPPSWRKNPTHRPTTTAALRRAENRAEHGVRKAVAS